MGLLIVKKFDDVYAVLTNGWTDRIATEGHGESVR